MDGKLYAAVGDNAYSTYAQTLTNLFGKILRINADDTIFFSGGGSDPEDGTLSVNALQLDDCVPPRSTHASFLGSHHEHDQ